MTVPRGTLEIFAISLLLAAGPSFDVFVAKNLLAASQSQASARIVKIDNFNFSPAVLSIPAGTNVTWINQDDVPHAIVSTDKQIISPALDTDEHFSFRFTAPGTYDYYCSVHPHMTGKVIVK
jgi:amicyanin